MVGILRELQSRVLGGLQRSSSWSSVSSFLVCIRNLPHIYAVCIIPWARVWQRPPEAPVRSGVLKCVDKRGRGRPKLTWDESVKRDLKIWDISEELALDRSAWRLAFNVHVPWPLCLLGFISSLPQLAWDKMLCCCCCCTSLFRQLHHPYYKGPNWNVWCMIKFQVRDMISWQLNQLLNRWYSSMARWWCVD